MDILNECVVCILIYKEKLNVDLICIYEDVKENVEFIEFKVFVR